MPKFYFRIQWEIMKKQYTERKNEDEAGKRVRAPKKEFSSSKEEVRNSKNDASDYPENASRKRRNTVPYKSGTSGRTRDSEGARDISATKKKEPSRSKTGGFDVKRKSSFNKDEKFTGSRRVSATSASNKREPSKFRTGDDNIKRKSAFNKDEGVAGRRRDSVSGREGSESGYRDSSRFKSEKPDFKSKPYIKKEEGSGNYKPKSDFKSNYKYNKYRTGNKRSGSGSPRLNPDDGTIRLNRYLSISGICSRRQADQYISEGLVSVNGAVISELGVKVKPDDIVKFNGETIRAEKNVYLLLNKPKDYITTAKDNEGRKTVYDLIRGACKERVFPVGRLDRNSMGVLLFTNDGELASRLSHPKYQNKKVYHVFLDKNLKLADFEKIMAGIELEDGFIKADDLSYVTQQKKSEVGIEIHSGKNRIVRRIFETLGYNVLKLDRVLFAGLTKKNIQRGKWRFLTEKEVNMLKMNAFE